MKKNTRGKGEAEDHVLFNSFFLNHSLSKHMLSQFTRAFAWYFRHQPTASHILYTSVIHLCVLHMNPSFAFHVSSIFCNFFPQNELQKSCKNSRFRAFFFNNIISKNIKEIIGVGRCTPCPPIFYVMALWVVEFSNGGYKNQHTQRK